MNARNLKHTKRGDNLPKCDTYRYSFFRVVNGNKPFDTLQLQGSSRLSDSRPMNRPPVM